MGARSARRVLVMLGIGVVLVADATAADAVDSRSVRNRPIAAARDVRAGRTIASAPPARATPPLDLSEPVIRRAIADSRDPLDDVVLPGVATFGASDATRQQGIDEAFRRAEIPTCVTTEAYRFDPPQVGPFGLGGLFALPFLVHAIATGKCRH